MRVDVGFVQGGETSGVNIENLISLGSLYIEPLLVFYRVTGSWNGSPSSRPAHRRRTDRQ